MRAREMHPLCCLAADFCPGRRRRGRRRGCSSPTPADGAAVAGVLQVDQHRQGLAPALVRDPRRRARHSKIRRRVAAEEATLEPAARASVIGGADRGAGERPSDSSISSLPRELEAVNSEDATIRGNPQSQLFKPDLSSSGKCSGVAGPDLKVRYLNYENETCKFGDSLAADKTNEYLLYVSLWSMIKDNVGKDLTRVCLPCFEELEYSYLLDRAYECGLRGNGLMRILYVAAFAVSGYASTDSRPCKPFNPLLGETYEADYPEKGIRFFSEKVTMACHCEGKGWKFWGYTNLNSKFWGQSIQLDPIGILTIDDDASKLNSHISRQSPGATLLWKKNEPQQIPLDITSSFAITLNELTPGLGRGTATILSFFKVKLPPTDSRLRPDQRHLENGEYEKANSETAPRDQTTNGKEHAGEGLEAKMVPKGH
ncbi:hypothetical protein ZWY2020_005699 [Hordeum vulgare]|nr:hypothetical protein ZWY2020_005699 [Hordeum vulgare]